MPYKDIQKRKQYSREYYQKYHENIRKDEKRFLELREYKRIVHAQYRARNNNIIDQIKQGQSCFYCDEFAPVCLDFHHIDKKDFNIGTARGTLFGLKTLIKEIEKCEIICSNCHRKKYGWQRGRQKNNLKNTIQNNKNIV
jgi:5-methylcytosine-specific restriction endonuclease McrA